MEVGKGGSLVEEGDGGLGIFGSLEGTLAFGEDEDDLRVMLTLEDCAFCDGSLVKVGKGGSLVEGSEFFMVHWWR